MALEVLATVAERGKRDLFFLAKDILGYNDFIERVHGPVCKFFVQKNPDFPLGKQSKRKNRAIFDPRSNYKTTLHICDVIQWILCFPNITAVLMSGSKELTKRQILEVKHHFTQNRIFREVYPDYCPQYGASDYGVSGEFHVPNRTMFRREPTLSISTVDSVKAGSHYDLRDGDDIVNEDNSKNPVQLAETTSDWNATRPLVNPGGYSHFIDTRYDFSDCGGIIIEKNPPVGRTIDLDGFGEMWHGRDWDIFIRGAWKTDAKGRKTLLFPEKFRTDDEDNPEKENLDAIQREDPYLFTCQYLNNPSPEGTQSFSRTALVEQTISRTHIPSNAMPFMAWYLGFNPQDTTDPAAGVIGAFSPDGNLYIIDLFRGLWNTDKIIDCFFTAHRKWCLRKIGVDDRNGPILIGPGLESKMREQRVFLPVDYLPIPRSVELRNKSVEGLVPLLTSKKLFFSSDCPHYDQLLMEFTRFGKYKYQGIPYAIAALAQHYRSAYARILSNVGPQEPVGEIYGLQQVGMFSDMQVDADDCQNLSAGIVG